MVKFWFWINSSIVFPKFLLLNFKCLNTSTYKTSKVCITLKPLAGLQWEEMMQDVSRKMRQNFAEETFLKMETNWCKIKSQAWLKTNLHKCKKMAWMGAIIAKERDQKWLEAGMSCFRDWYPLDSQILKLTPYLAEGASGEALQQKSWRGPEVFKSSLAARLHLNRELNWWQPKGNPCCGSTILGIADKESQTEIFINFQNWAISVGESCSIFLSPYLVNFASLKIYIPLSFEKT